MRRTHAIGMVMGLAAFGLNGCGGGGGGSGSFPGNGSSSTVPAKYRATSYDSSSTSDLTLTGTWMYIAQREIDINSPPFLQVAIDDHQRSTILINDNEDGSATVIDCLLDGVRQQTANTNGGTIIFNISNSLRFEGSIVNNNLLEGQLISVMSEVVVQSSDVSLIKINDNPAYLGGSSLGQFSQTLTHHADSSLSGVLSNQAIHCFMQVEGESTNTATSDTWTSTTLYFASIDEPVVPVNISSEVWLEAYFVELSFSNDASYEPYLQTQTPASSSMGTFYQAGDITVQLSNDDVDGVTGQAADDLVGAGSDDIEIDFDISL